MLFFEKNNMPFNLKKFSAVATSIHQSVFDNIMNKLQNPDFLSELFQSTPDATEVESKEQVQPEKNKVILQTWSDTITDKVKNIVNELKRKNAPIDRQYNFETKYKGGNTDYKKITSLASLYKKTKDDRTFEFRKTTINLIDGKYKENYASLTYQSLNLKESDSLENEIAHFEKQKDKCYYCGRDLYSGKFNQNNIHLEHLVDKANWIDQIIDGEELMMKFFDTAAESFSNYEKAKEDASYIKAIIQSNAVNSLQNWMYADSECNLSKMDLPHFEFINFMKQIQNVNTPEILNKNKEIYKNFSANNENYKGKKPSDINTTGKSKSYEIYHEFLSSLIENSTPNYPEDLASKLYLTVGTPPSHVLEKIDELQDILSSPQYKQVIDTESYISRKNSFDSLIRDKKASDFKNKKTLFATKNECLCGICGRQISEPSPLNRVSTSTVFDITESLDDFQWQLIHSDCAARCGNLSVRTLRFLAQQISQYTPEREKITASLGPNIENIYKTFVRHLDDLRNQLSSASILQVAFNLAKFIRRGGR